MELNTWHCGAGLNDVCRYRSASPGDCAVYEAAGDYKIVPEFYRAYLFSYAWGLIISVHQFKYFRKDV
jgi:hypothetical protein